MFLVIQIARKFCSGKKSGEYEISVPAFQVKDYFGEPDTTIQVKKDFQPLLEKFTIRKGTYEILNIGFKKGKSVVIM